MSRKRKRIREWFRSAITGRFVKRSTAERHPDKTIHQRRRDKP